MNKTKLLIVGGFLAAGKTTMLNTLASHLSARGCTVGLITNDQAPDLVDTAILLHSGALVREVSGSCFCCNFQGFIDAIQSLIQAGSDIIVAEPVGSCTDLSATILQPVKDKFPNLDLAPLSVLVDPIRLREALDIVPSLTHPDALYIVKRQLEEADRILLNKSDTRTTQQVNDDLEILKTHFTAPSAPVSALFGSGVDQWIDDVLSVQPAGLHLADIDYERYAHGEAVLGWLNADAILSPAKQVDWGTFAQVLLENCKKAFSLAHAEIGHVKLSINTIDSFIFANLASINAHPNVKGNAIPPDATPRLTFNARVQMSPDDLQTAVESILATTAQSFHIAITITDLNCLTPGRPSPSFRYHSIV